MRANGAQSADSARRDATARERRADALSAPRQVLPLRGAARHRAAGPRRPEPRPHRPRRAEERRQRGPEPGRRRPRRRLRHHCPGPLADAPPRHPQRRRQPRARRRAEISLLTLGVAQIPDIVALQLGVEGSDLPILVADQAFSQHLADAGLDPVETLTTPRPRSTPSAATAATASSCPAASPRPATGSPPSRCRSRPSSPGAP